MASAPAFGLRTLHLAAKWFGLHLWSYYQLVVQYLQIDPKILLLDLPEGYTGNLSQVGPSNFTFTLSPVPPPPLLFPPTNITLVMPSTCTELQVYLRDDQLMYENLNMIDMVSSVTSSFWKANGWIAYLFISIIFLTNLCYIWIWLKAVPLSHKAVNLEHESTNDSICTSEIRRLILDGDIYMFSPFSKFWSFRFTDAEICWSTWKGLFTAALVDLQDLTVKLVNAEADIRQFEEKVATQEKQSGSWEELLRAKKRIEELEQYLVASETESCKKDRVIEEARSRAEKADRQNKDTEREYIALCTKTEQDTKSIKQLETNLSAANNHIKELQDKMKKQGETSQRRYNELTAECKRSKQLTDQVAELELNLSRLEEQNRLIPDLREQLASLKRQFDALNAESLALKNANNTLMNEENLLNKEIEALKNKLSLSQSKCDALATKLTASQLTLEKERSQFEDDFQSIRSRLSEATNEKEILRKELEERKLKIENLEGVSSSLKSDLRKSRDELGEVRKDYESLQEACNAQCIAMGEAEFDYQEMIKLGQEERAFLQRKLEDAQESLRKLEEGIMAIKAEASEQLKKKDDEHAAIVSKLQRDFKSLKGRIPTTTKPPKRAKNKSSNSNPSNDPNHILSDKGATVVNPTTSARQDCEGEAGTGAYRSNLLKDSASVPGQHSATVVEKETITSLPPPLLDSSTSAATPSSTPVDQTTALDEVSQHLYTSHAESTHTVIDSHANICVGAQGDADAVVQSSSDQCPSIVSQSSSIASPTSNQRIHKENAANTLFTGLKSSKWSMRS
ncbi:uncharacterized protein PV09_01187 [Verruconis gallopava]|uniref:Uncharacterized protein n=1 Tax=Verruconis gallopava TaxID=253628 RepID=A0A0D2BAB5_9PEZI|nr:uncharacterized protein PV09_01187 [Verruconis gallopava]KIW08264.1 hypothetical protein PV09_01187 [Verruconis gallopava]